MSFLKKLFCKPQPPEPPGKHGWFEFGFDFKRCEYRQFSDGTITFHWFVGSKTGWVIAEKSRRYFLEDPQ